MNNKPNYNREKPRYKILNLMHIAVVLSPRSLNVFENKQQLADLFVKMRKEGIVEKNRGSEIFESISVSKYEEIRQIFPESNQQYYLKKGKADLKKAKLTKKNTTESTRIIQNCEITTLMYSAGIACLPDIRDEKIEDYDIKESVYFQSHEIKKYSNYQVQTSSASGKRIPIQTRMNGILISKGGNYLVYNIGRAIKNYTFAGEYNIINTLENMLSEYNMPKTHLIEEAVLVSYTIKTQLQFFESNKKTQQQINELFTTFRKGVYLISLDRYGKEMIKLMSESNWKEKLKSWALGGVQDTSKLDRVCDYYEDGEYIFLYCIPDIQRYKVFVEQAKILKTKKSFKVKCFDHQLDFVRESLRDKNGEIVAQIESCAMEEYLYG